MTGGAPTGRGEAVRVAILADDLTGAGDTAVQFAEAGWPAFLQRTRRPPDLPEVAAVAQPLATRALPDDAAALRTAEAVADQLAAGVTRLYVKIDSTMRGSVAAQLRGAVGAWRARHAGAFVVLCPAYPEMDRTVQDGRVWVAGRPLDRSPAGSDPVTPVRTSAMAELVPGAIVVPALPRDALGPALVEAGRRAPVVVAEAQTPEHLRLLAGAIAALGPAALPSGSAGLALPLASAWRPPGRDAGPAAFPAVTGRIVVGVSSANEVSRRQVRVCAEELGTRMQTAALGREDVTSPERAAAWASRLALAPAVQVLAVTAPAERLEELGPVAGGRRVAGALAAALHRLVERDGAGALVLVGGDGAEATLDRLGVPALRILRRAVEGVPVADVPGRPGLLVVTKAGGFGADGTLLDVVERLRGPRG